MCEPKRRPVQARRQAGTSANTSGLSGAERMHDAAIHGVLLYLIGYISDNVRHMTDRSESMEIRKTKQRLRTLEILAEMGVSHGFEIASKAGLKVGTVYGILLGFEQNGSVESRWEEGEPAGRPRRKLYQLTADGRALLTEYRAHFGPQASRGLIGAVSNELHTAIDQVLGSMSRGQREREKSALKQLSKEIADT